MYRPHTYNHNKNTLVVVVNTINNHNRMKTVCIKSLDILGFALAWIICSRKVKEHGAGFPFYQM